MAGTILPMVHGDRRHNGLMVDRATHILGSVLGSAIVGGALGLIGYFVIPSHRGSIDFLVLALVAGLGSLRDTHIASVPAPQLDRAVPH